MEYWEPGGRNTIGWNTRAQCYECAQCGITSKDLEVMRDHASSHINEGVHRCPSCQYSHIWRSQVQRHAVRAHTRKEDTWECPRCRQAWYNKHAMYVHYPLCPVRKVEGKEDWVEPALGWRWTDPDKIDTNFRRQTVNDPVGVGTNEVERRTGKSDEGRGNTVVQDNHGHRDTSNDSSGRAMHHSAPLQAQEVLQVANFQGPPSDAQDQTNDARFPCVQCLYSTKDEHRIERHVAAVHQPEPFKVQCESCHQAWAARSAMFQHQGVCPVERDRDFVRLGRGWRWEDETRARCRRRTASDPDEEGSEWVYRPVMELPKPPRAQPQRKRPKARDRNSRGQTRLEPPVPTSLTQYPLPDFHARAPTGRLAQPNQHLFWEPPRATGFDPVNRQHEATGFQPAASMVFSSPHSLDIPYLENAHLQPSASFLYPSFQTPANQLVPFQARGFALHPAYTTPAGSQETWQPRNSGYHQSADIPSRYDPLPEDEVSDPQTWW